MFPQKLEEEISKCKEPRSVHPTPPATKPKPSRLTLSSAIATAQESSHKTVLSVAKNVPSHPSTPPHLSVKERAQALDTACTETKSPPKHQEMEKVVCDL